MSKVKVNAILKAFERYDGVYKREQVDEAIELKEEITPYLIEILQKVLEDPLEYLYEDYNSHIYAAVLLAHFKERKAHKIIVDLFSIDSDLIDELYSDMITEDLPMILYRTCGGSLELIKSLSMNKDANVYCRASALSALTFAVADNTELRDEIMTFFGSLFTDEYAVPENDFISMLANHVCDLYPEELMDKIERAYDDEWIDPYYISPEEFEEALEGEIWISLLDIREHMQVNPLDDVHKSMSWWACFNEKKKSPDEEEEFDGKEEFLDERFKKIRQQIHSWGEKFVESEYFEKLTEEQKDNNVFVVTMFADYMYTHIGQSPEEWDVEGLEECCLEILPRKISADESYYRCITPALSAYLGFLGEKGYLNGTESLIASLKMIDKQMIENARNPANWGIAKSFTMRAKDAGVDTHNEKELYKYITDYNEQLAKEREITERKPQKSEKIGRNDPCPCGSGKKYKKCCGKVK